MSFFQIDPAQAIAILRLLHTEDAREALQAQVPIADQQEVAAGEQFRSRRPNLNFAEMGIPTGSNLSSTSTDATVTVCGPKRVRLGCEEMFLTAATRQVLGLDYSIAPTFAWTHDGRLLRDIYNDTYADLG